MCWVNHGKSFRLALLILYNWKCNWIILKAIKIIQLYSVAVRKSWSLNDYCKQLNPYQTVKPLYKQKQNAIFIPPQLTNTPCNLWLQMIIVVYGVSWNRSLGYQTEIKNFIVQYLKQWRLLWYKIIKQLRMSCICFNESSIRINSFYAHIQFKYSLLVRPIVLILISWCVLNVYGSFDR